MMKFKAVLGVMAVCLNYGHVNAQIDMHNNHPLTNRQKSIIAVAAFTANGDLQKLRPALNQAFDADLTISDAREMLVQLYAYCGFPRSLNAINTLVAVLNERKVKGIKDPEGVQPFVHGDNTGKYEMGKKNLERLTGRSESGPKTGYAAFAPIIDTFLKEHLFADIFSRGVLSDQDRELTTIAALASLGNVEPQLQGHLGISLSIGFTENQVEEMLSFIETGIGKQQADVGRSVLSKVMAGRRQPR